MTRFLRRIHHKYHKLGKKKGKKRVWRKPKGRDNKMREKRRGYGPTVSVGYRQSESERKPIPVLRNVNELTNVTKGQQIIVGNLGRRKKIEFIKKAHERGVFIVNINSKKFLKKNTKENKNELR